MSAVAVTKACGKYADCFGVIGNCIVVFLQKKICIRAGVVSVELVGFSFIASYRVVQGVHIINIDDESIH